MNIHDNKVEWSLAGGRNDAAMLSLTMGFLAYLSCSADSVLAAGLCSLTALLSLANSFDRHQILVEYRADQKGKVSK